jgi:hypothetical protein
MMPARCSAASEWSSFTAAMARLRHRKAVVVLLVDRCGYPPPEWSIVALHTLTTKTHLQIIGPKTVNCYQDDPRCNSHVNDVESPPCFHCSPIAKPSIGSPCGMIHTSISLQWITMVA